MTRYVGTTQWLDVDQQNIALWSPGQSAPAVWPLPSMVQVQLIPANGGGVLAMRFAPVGVPDGAAVPSQWVRVEFGEQAEPAFAALARWMNEVASINDGHGSAAPVAAPAPVAGAVAPVGALATPSAQAPVVPGRLPVIDPAGVPIVLKPGEVVHASFNAELLKQTVQREFVGGSTGISIPLGHGVRLRTGAMRGHSVEVGTQMTVQDAGVLVVTSLRTVFIGHQRSLEFDYHKLVGLQQYTDGLALSVSNRQAVSVFRFTPGESSDLAIALISHLGRAP